MLAMVPSLLLLGTSNVGAKVTATPGGSFPTILTATATKANGGTLTHSVTVGLNVN